jgi:type VI protein secretion system component Hcp
MSTRRKTSGAVRRVVSFTSLRVALPVTAALGGGAAFAVAAIPGSDGTISACYTTVPGPSSPYGALRVIDPTNTTSTNPNEYSCGISEKTISWNQRGPAGSAGPAGSSGPVGATGRTGNTGAVGPTGALASETSFGVTAKPGVLLVLRLKGIKGPVTEPAFAGAIPLSSFSLATAGIASGPTKKTVQLFEVHKAVDVTSPVLFKDLSAGTVIQAGEIDVLHGTLKTNTKVASYHFSDVRIIKLIDHGTGASAEDVEGQFKSETGTVGSGKNVVQTQWNQVKNSPTLVVAPPGAG